MVLSSNFKSVDSGKILLTANAFLPSHALIPLEELEDGTAEILVSAGDSVKEGQVIARAANSYIHSSIPGIIEDIGQYQYGNGKQGLCAKIALKGSMTFTGKKKTESSFSFFESSTLSFMLKEAGVINTFEGNIPVYRQIKEIEGKENRILVIRLFDDDPSRLTEDFVSFNYTRQVVTGAAILAKSIKAHAVVLAKAKNSQLNMKEWENLFEPAVRILEIEVDTRKYPCGTKHDIVKTAKKASDDAAFRTLGKNDFFADSITCYHAFNAVVLGKPQINEIIHVTGDCLNSAAIMNIKAGTSLKDVVEQCGGFKRKLSKIIINGIVKGTSVSSLDIPVSKTMKSVEFVPVKQVRAQYPEICVRCGNCRKICPVNLWPGNLYRIMNLSGQPNELLNSKSIMETAILCTECGLCNSACPARLPLSQTISLLKEKLNENQ